MSVVISWLQKNEILWQWEIEVLILEENSAVSG